MHVVPIAIFVGRRKRKTTNTTKQNHHQWPPLSNRSLTYTANSGFSYIKVVFPANSGFRYCSDPRVEFIDDEEISFLDVGESSETKTGAFVDVTPVFEFKARRQQKKDTMRLVMKRAMETPMPMRTLSVLPRTSATVGLGVFVVMEDDVVVIDIVEVIVGNEKSEGWVELVPNGVRIDFEDGAELLVNEIGAVILK